MAGREADPDATGRPATPDAADVGAGTGRSEAEWFHEARRFLHREAEKIDDRQFDDWLAMMTDDVRYRIPARQTRSEGGKGEFRGDAHHVDDNRFMLETRVERLETEHAWAEQPRSRTRHFVSNVRVVEADEGEMTVKSNLLLHINRGDDPDSHTISGERHDTLRSVDGEWKLADRTVYLDHATLPIGTISVFI